MTDFGQQVEKFARKVEKRFRATARKSIEETVALAQRVEKKGGTMRVKTGFLRASVQGSLNTLPSGPTTNPEGTEYDAKQLAAGEPISVTLLKWDPNKEQPFFVGWTANYARYREARDGFLRTATDQWDITVAKVAKEVGNRIG